MQMSVISAGVTAPAVRHSLFQMDNFSLKIVKKVHYSYSTSFYLLELLIEALEMKTYTQCF